VLKNQSYSFNIVKKLTDAVELRTARWELS